MFRVVSRRPLRRNPPPHARPKGKRLKTMTTAPRRNPLTLRQLHEFLGGELIGSPDATVIGIASLEQAGPDDLAFLASERSKKTIQSASIGVLLVGKRLADVA